MRYDKRPGVLLPMIYFLAALTSRAGCIDDASRLHHVNPDLLQAILTVDQQRLNDHDHGTRYQALFDRAAAVYAPLVGADPTAFAKVLRRIAQAESGFRQEIINGHQTSRTGAQGIMQIQPDVARAINVNPLIPSQAIMGAGYLLAQRMILTGGDLLAASAAYNGAFAHLQDGRWKIETRDYVNKVFGAGSADVLRHGYKVNLFDQCSLTYVRAWSLAEHVKQYGPTWRAVAASQFNAANHAEEIRKQQYIAAVSDQYQHIIEHPTPQAISNTTPPTSIIETSKTHRLHLGG